MPTKGKRAKMDYGKKVMPKKKKSAKKKKGSYH